MKVGSRCWICAGVTICCGVEIGREAVVGAGARVESSVEERTVVGGRPAKMLKKVKKGNYIKTPLFQFTDRQKEVIFENLRRNFNVSLNKKVNENIEKLLCGEIYNIYQIKFFRGTELLCREFNDEKTSKARRDEILEILFPLHGKNFVVEGKIFVDIAGTIIIGDDVCIKGGANLAGNIIIGNGVTIGKNLIMHAAGHSLVAKERGTKLTLHGPVNTGFNGFVKIEDGVSIGDDVVVVPNSHVSQDLPSGCVFAGEKIVAK